MKKFFLLIFDKTLLVYRYFFSPILHLFFGAGAGCRFTPTCSEYFQESVKTFGLISGLRLGIIRILKCNPMIKGGWDPVPPEIK